MEMENSFHGSSRKSSFRKGSSRIGSFRLSLGGKDETVIELGNIDTEILLFESGEIKQKQKKVTNTLSVRQMKSLTALADTILPSVNDFDFPTNDDGAAATFYRVSASMAGTPDLVYIFLLLLYTIIYSYIFLIL